MGIDYLLALCKRDLLAYTKLCDSRYRASCSGVHRYLAGILSKVATGEQRRVIINMPPRHGKSRLTTVEMPTWALGNNPRLQVVLASYAANLAEKHSLEARYRMGSGTYRAIFPDTQLGRGRVAAGEWTTTEGGGFRAVGIGSGLSGHGADILIVDDPVKDPEEAHSPTMRDKVWDWFLGVGLTRLSPQGRVVVIMTRWHTDDLVGRLIDPARQAEMKEAGVGEEWFCVNLKALAEGEDPLNRPEGAALFPEHYPAESMIAKKQALGSYLWNALYRGQPVPKGGKYVDASWFIQIDKNQVPDGLSLRRFWDLATSEKREADFTVGAKGGLDKAGNFYLLDLTRGQWPWPKARSVIKGLAESERILIGVEAVGGFKTTVDNLREVVDKSVVVHPIGVETDKLTRALPWIALAENRKMFVVRGPWLSGFLAECEQFPGGAHDDQVDAVSGLYEMARSGRRIVIV